MGLSPLEDDASGDEDNDALSNLQEYLHKTNSTNADTDADGMPDGWEVLMHLDPTVNDASSDFDGDKMPNEWEYQYG